ncbi:hypothetical protein F183_A55290 (plasmid) [Bryobacterales bacterium F-183]|nr:hypothetical protein F183_A55290 [Bryobacterales bacterium F-183]
MLENFQIATQESEKNKKNFQSKNTEALQGLFRKIYNIPDGVRVALLRKATFYAYRTSFDEEDLLAEAQLAYLEGRRTWRPEVPRFKQLRAAMRSIASNYRRKQINIRRVDGGLGLAGALRPGAESVLHDKALARIEALLPEELKRHHQLRLEGKRGKALCEELGLTWPQYLAQKRKLERRLGQLRLAIKEEAQ